ncbi:MAG: hypothetical protein ACT4QD_17760 [Acidobacteriota bacterium]
MAVDRRTRGLLAVVGVAIAALVAVRWLTGSPDAAPVSRAPARERAPRDAGGDGQSTPVDVNLAALTGARSEPAGSGRDPFRFRPKPAPAPLVPPTNAPTRLPADPAGGTAAPGSATAIPPIALKLIGLVQKADGTKIAVLTDGRHPLYGVEGQDLEGQYRILKIGTESIEIAYLDGRGRKTIPLTGQ